MRFSPLLRALASLALYVFHIFLEKINTQLADGSIILRIIHPNGELWEVIKLWLREKEWV